MGLFDFMKKKQNVVTNNTVTNTAQQTGILNLKKNDILDLTKTAPALNKMRVAAGWDVNRGTTGLDYDLDLCAILLDNKGKLVKSINNCVYYGSKTSKGIRLDGDNLTGEGDGDDENIFVTLDKIPSEVDKIVFNVVIYEAKSRKQSFQYVENAYVRIVNEQSGIEICKYNLSEDGGDNTAVIFAELYRENNNWNFRAIGDYKKASISKLKKMYE